MTRLESLYAQDKTGLDVWVLDGSWKPDSIASAAITLLATQDIPFDEDVDDLIDMKPIA